MKSFATHFNSIESDSKTLGRSYFVEATDDFSVHPFLGVEKVRELYPHIAAATW